MADLGDVTGVEEGADASHHVLVILPLLAHVQAGHVAALTGVEAHRAVELVGLDSAEGFVPGHQLLELFGEAPVPLLAAGLEVVEHLGDGLVDAGGAELDGGPVEAHLANPAGVGVGHLHHLGAEAEHDLLHLRLDSVGGPEDRQGPDRDDEDRQPEQLGDQADRPAEEPLPRSLSLPAHEHIPPRKGGTPPAIFSTRSQKARLSIMLMVSRSVLHMTM